MKLDSANTNSQRKIKCPHCGLFIFYSVENPFRPFCSERCRLIDLGQWADESYKVPDHKEAQTYQEETDTQNALDSLDPDNQDS